MDPPNPSHARLVVLEYRAPHQCGAYLMRDIGTYKKTTREAGRLSIREPYAFARPIAFASRDFLRDAAFFLITPVFAALSIAL